MSKLTAEELYNKLLEIKAKDANHNFNFDDLMAIGLAGTKDAYKALVDSGKINEKNDIIGSFELE